MIDELIGQQVLNRYRIVQALGQGGMGVVYLGRTEGAEGFTRPVVVKSVRPELLKQAEMADMFVSEARILSNLSHPGIVRVLDFGREDSRYFMVLEYVNGYDLGRWRRFLAKTQRKVPINIAVYIVCQVLAALHYAHTARRGDGTSLKTIHRDVSPGNILLSDEGQVRLVDFGIASVASEFAENTGKVSFKGKFVYAAPELLEGGKPTPRSDIYAAGLVLYQLIAGRNPFNARTDAEVVARVESLPLPSLREARPETSAHLEAVVRTALSRSPSQRFESAAHFADALRSTQDIPDDQLRQVLAERLRADFYGTLPEVMKVERLDQRHEAWRFAAAAKAEQTRAAEQEPHRLSRPSLATVVQGAQASPLLLPVLSGKQRRRRRRLIWELSGLAVAATLCGWLWRDAAAPMIASTSARPRFSATQPVLGPEPVAAPSAAEVSTAYPASGGTATENGAPAEDDTEAETPLPTSKALRLANTVADHAALIGECARRHGIDSPLEDIRLGFQLRTDGTVRSVTLLPNKFASSEFGTCVAVGYMAVQFGPQGRAIKFHIPVQLEEVLSAFGWKRPAADAVPGN